MARRAAQPNDPQGPRAVAGAAARPPRLIDYPRSARRGWRRWVPSWKLVTGLAGVGLGCAIVAFVTAYNATSIPTRDQTAQAQATIVYYAGGKTELGRFQVQNRRSVELAKVPVGTRNAVLAAEDRSFYRNRGVSPTGIVRAAWNNARGGAVQGGSTITQQYVKNTFDLRDRTLRRKAKEFFIALKVNRNLDKDQILENYLNTIYLGRKAYGIEAAAQAYFGVPVQKLTVSQSAYLAGIISGPELYDPRDGKDSAARARARWTYVLDGMVDEGWLSPQDLARMRFPKTVKVKAQNTLSGQKGYLLGMVRQEVTAKAGITDRDLESSGLKIVTTFDRKLIAQAVDAVKSTLPGSRPKGTQVGMASIDPATGAVRAIYGGTGYLARQRNAATEDQAQAGSTFKPFALVAGLEEGVSLRSRFNGANGQTFEGDARVVNFGGSSYGYIDLLRATASSVNTVYVGLNEQIGPAKTMSAAIRAGLPKGTPGLDDQLSNVLGPSSPHPIDMASAFSTFAAQGVRHPPFAVASVTRPDGSKAYRNKGAGKRVFDTDVMADATYAMQQVVQGGSGSYAQALGRPAAGKTGTSSENKSAWFVGYTPQLSTAVAMYRVGKGGKALDLQGWGSVGEITGGSYPVQIWTSYMQQALDGTKVMDFPDPSYAGDVVNPEPPPTTTDPEPSSEPSPTSASPEPSPEPSVSATRPRPRPTFPRPTSTKRP